jgi:hypothetical protein
MTTLFNSLRQYCMAENTFDETDFRRVLEGVLQTTPNLASLKFNLPFQVIGRASRTATLLLATTFACFASRPAEFCPLKTLVLDHVSDSTILDIAQNPIDLGNALATFRSLKNLVVSIKRQESGTTLVNVFANRLWLLITEAARLESLCITGWNVKSAGPSRRRRPRVDFNEWMMKSLPYPDVENRRIMKHLRFLELRRIEIDPIALKRLIEDHSQSLKELYLNEVYLKVLESTALWIGHGSLHPRPQGCCWLAEDLRKIESLKLEVLRVSGLGYNDFDPGNDDQPETYDLVDPLGFNRSLEERFVEAVLGPSSLIMTPEGWSLRPSSLMQFANTSNPFTFGAGTAAGPSSPSKHVVELASLARTRSSSTSSLKSAAPRKASTPKVNYDVDAFQRVHNTTSHWKASIDGLFINHNEKALMELQKIISVADKGMSFLSDEIDRLHSLTGWP